MTRRILALSLAAATAVVPATAFAKAGADDPAPHVTQARGADDPAPHVAGADDTTPHATPSQSSTKAAKKSRVRVAGACSPGVTSKLVLKKRNGMIEAEFEVDQNKVGKTWSVSLLGNGVAVKSVSATTKAPSGSFEVKARVADGAGTDVVKATATGPSGETCSATASI